MGIYKVPEVTTAGRMTKIFAKREIVCDTDNNTFYTGDGVTLGGIPIGANVVGAGSIWRSGAGAPDNSLGVNGDYYLNTSNSDVYLRTAGTYSIVVNIKGTTGAAGANGTNGTNGSVWRSGTGLPSNVLGVDGDYYLNTTTSDVYLRSAGAYSVVVNIKGATGAAGANGTNGSVWRSGAGVPSNGLGVDGDYYLKTTTGDVYFRSGGTYSIAANIKGADGSGLSSAIQLASSFAPTMLPKFAAAFAKMRAGQGNARIVVLGDSTTDGGVDVGWAHQLANMLMTSGAAPATHNANLGFNLTDARIVKGSSWSVDNTILSAGGATWKASTNTNSMAITPNTPCDTFKLWYVKRVGGGVLSVDYDGLGTTNIDTNAAAGVGSVTLSAPDLGHTFNIKWVSGGQVNTIGYEAYSSNRKCVQVIKAGLGGTASQDWVDSSQPYSWLPTVIAAAPHLTIITSGINECAGTIDLTTYRTNLDTIIAQAKTVGDVLVLTGNPANPADGTHNQSTVFQQTYRDVVRAAATAAGVPLIDIFNRWIDYDTANALGYLGDTWVHPSVIGYSDIANTIFSFLLMATGRGRGTNQRMFSNDFEMQGQLWVRGNKLLGTSSLSSTSMYFGINCPFDSSGAFNAGFGYDALASNTVGFNNTAFGYQALKSNISGQGLTAFGQAALKNCTGNWSTALGHEAGQSATSCDYSGFFGRGAGYNGGTGATTTGDNVWLFGYRVIASSPTASNEINICDILKGRVGKDNTLADVPNAGVSIMGVDSLIGVLKGANFNTTADQAIALLFPGNKYEVTGMTVTNASTSLTNAAGGLYSAAAKGGTAIVAAAQTYANCTAATKLQKATISAAGQADTFNAATLYLSLTTAQGAAATADVYIYGRPMV